MNRTLFPDTPCGRWVFLAPMAGIGLSPFRRLVASYGTTRYTALYTEMLPGRLVVHKNPATDIHLRRRPDEGRVVCQILLTGGEDLEAVLAKILPMRPDGLDLNIACPAPAVRRVGSGFRLFNTPSTIRRILEGIRRHWSGPLSVKCRLGEARGREWRPGLREVLKSCHDGGADFAVLHGRFADDKLKRDVRRDLMAEALAFSPLPLVANGDILDPDPSAFPGFAGVMLGRIVVARPWVFRQAQDPSFVPDHLETWDRLVAFLREEHPREEEALEFLRLFVSYYSRNFLFGHLLFRNARNARSVEELDGLVRNFLASSPPTVRLPCLAQL